jgi:hypothetical protein
LKGRSIELWGYGGAKNVQTLYAYGICHAIEEIAADAGNDNVKCHAWLASIGFLENLYKFMPAWIANGGRNSSGKVPDAYDELKRLWIATNELCLNLGDGVNQAANLASSTTSIPSRNLAPLTTFGNWF